MKNKKKKIAKQSFNTLVNKSKLHNFNLRFKKKAKAYFTGLWNPQFKIFIAYIGFALLGAVLLAISEYQKIGKPQDGEGITFNFGHALFTAVSAFSNTGLIVQNTGENFTIPGQIVIYFLIQVGGFGLLSTFFLLGKSFNKIFFKGKEFKSILGHTEKGQTKISSSFRILVVIFFIIFIIQLLATFVLWPIFYLIDFNYMEYTIPSMNKDNGVGYGDLGLSFWNALFTTGSAMNNAGFDLFTTASGGSLGTFFAGPGVAVQSIVLILFVFGGIGYMVVYDFWKRTTFFIYRKHPKLYQKLINAKLSENFDGKPKISIYTKICLLGNLLILIVTLVVAYAVIWISYETFKGNVSSDATAEIGWIKQRLEGIDAQGNDIGRDYKPWEINFAIFFNTMSTRSAGFSTFDMYYMADASKWLFSISMIIGTSPSSTGGGVRVTTVVVIISMIWQKIRGIEYSTIFHKQIALKTKINASITLILASSFIIFATFYVTLFNDGINFTDAFFLASSAFGTTGLSTVSTGVLSWVSYFVIIPLMIFGQLGVTSTLETFNVGRNKYTKTEPQSVEFRVG